MSALPPKADMDQHGCDVRFVPKADIGERQKETGDGPALPPFVASVPKGLADRLGIYLLGVTKRQSDKPHGITDLHAHQDLMLAL